MNGLTLFLIAYCNCLLIIVSSETITKCSSACKDREVLKKIKLQMVKSEILDRLGLSSPPNGTSLSQSRIKQFMKRYKHHNQYVEQLQRDDPYNTMFSGIIIDNEEDDHFQMQIINILASQVPPDFPSQVPSLATNGKFLFFNLHSEQMRPNWHELSRADLYIHLPSAPTPNDLKASIHLYYVSLHNNTNELSLARSIKVNLKLNKGGWVDLKVFDVCMYWLKYPELNFGFVVEIYSNSGIKLNVSTEPEPYLKLDLMESSTNTRKKRTISKVCNEETDASSTNCCLWPLEVDFHKEYGWEFIIFPSKYEANYCAGDCNIGVTPEYTHTHLMMQNQKSQAGLSPCCTPKKISPVPLMYIDENENVILGKIPNMKVDRCGCA
ncbi:growth/differentiation factor 8 [Lepeophtheirus salmonis]|nr:growth/differentiation factor 8-like [Lepeophtheirus salmonis]